MRQFESVQVFLEPLRLLDGVQVGPLDVLDEGRLEDLLVVEGDDVDRHLGEPGFLRGAQPALARDELVAVVDLPHHQRLQNAVVLDARREGREFLPVELLAGLVGVIRDLLDGQFADAHGVRGGCIADEGVEPSGQSRLGGRFHASLSGFSLVVRVHSNLRGSEKWNRR